MSALSPKAQSSYDDAMIVVPSESLATVGKNQLMPANTVALYHTGSDKLILLTQV
jgi:hypothetical protein